MTSKQAPNLDIAVGSRFVLTDVVERYPHFIADAGMIGTVMEASKDIVRLRMDKPLKGAEEWDNEIVWTDDYDAQPHEVDDADPDARRAFLNEAAIGYNVEGPEATPVPEGMRVRCVVGMAVERSTVGEGMTGTVMLPQQGNIVVRLDDHLEILDEWDNELIVVDENDPLWDFGNNPDVDPNMLRAFWYHFAPLDGEVA